MFMAVDTKTDERIEAQLKALADPTRRRIIELLKRKGCCSCDLIDMANAGLCLCDLEAELKLSQPTITHHIQVLRDAGLVRTQKIGRWVYCRREEEVLDCLSDWLRKL